MTTLPYFCYFPKDMGYKIAHLTLAEDGAYHRLLRLCWTTTGCTIPNDINWIARKCLCRSQDDIDVLQSVLDEFFHIKKDRYYNKRLSEEYDKSNAKHKARVDAGKRGGHAKSLKSNNKSSSKAIAKTKQTSTNHNHTHNHINNHTIINNFIPKELNKNTKTYKLIEKHMTSDELELQLEKFIAYHTDKQTKSTDFNRQWRAWLQNNVQWKLEKTGDKNVKQYNTTTKLKEIGDSRRKRRGELLNELQAQGLAKSI